MNKTNIAFILTLIAGLSTLIGTIPIFIKIKSKNKVICSSLSFAAGVMITVSITDLIPESLNMLESYNTFIMLLLVFTFLVLGIIISRTIDTFLIVKENNSLYKVGIISMIAIILHNIPEGIATFISTTKSIRLGLSLTIAIALHNIPEGISISVPIYYSTKSKFKAFFYTIVSALSEPLGALITYIFLFKYINNTILGLIYALIAGLMVEISFRELLPESLNYKEKKLSKIFFILGIIFMLLKIIF